MCYHLEVTDPVMNRLKHLDFTGLSAEGSTNFIYHGSQLSVWFVVTYASKGRLQKIKRAKFGIFPKVGRGIRFSNISLF